MDLCNQLSFFDLSSLVKFSLLLQPVGLLKLMLNLFHTGSYKMNFTCVLVENISFTLDGVFVGICELYDEGCL